MRLAVATLLQLAVSSAAIAASPPSADAVLRDIESRGAHAVRLEIWSDQARTDAVLEQIETGRHEWLEVASRLRAVSDAGASLDLDFSVARALLKQPERVLRLIGRGFEIDRICTSPFIEPEKGVAEQYEKQALKMLSRLERSGVAHAGECAARVRLPRPRVASRATFSDRTGRAEETG